MTVSTPSASELSGLWADVPEQRRAIVERALATYAAPMPGPYRYSARRAMYTVLLEAGAFDDAQAKRIEELEGETFKASADAAEHWRDEALKSWSVEKARAEAFKALLSEAEKVLAGKWRDGSITHAEYLRRAEELLVKIEATK